MRFISSLAAVVLSVSATAFAQQTSAAPAKGGVDDRKAVTVVGCLQNGAQPNQFVLIATADPLAKGVAVATAGVVPNVTYVLSSGTNLGAHVGHRIEVKGKTSDHAQKAVSTDSNAKRVNIPNKPDAKVETKEKATIEMRDLQVDSFKMVSTNCSAK